MSNVQGRRPKGICYSGPLVRMKSTGLFVPWGVVSTTRYLPGMRTNGGTSPVLGRSLGAKNAIRVPPSVEAKSGMLISPNVTVFPWDAKPVPVTVTSIW